MGNNEFVGHATQPSAPSSLRTVPASPAHSPRALDTSPVPMHRFDDPVPKPTYTQMLAELAIFLYFVVVAVLFGASKLTGGPVPEHYYAAANAIIVVALLVIFVANLSMQLLHEVLAFVVETTGLSIVLETLARLVRLDFRPIVELCINIGLAEFVYFVTFQPAFLGTANGTVWTAQVLAIIGVIVVGHMVAKAVRTELLSSSPGNIRAAFAFPSPAALIMTAEFVVAMMWLNGVPCPSPLHDAPSPITLPLLNINLPVDDPMILSSLHQQISVVLLPFKALSTASVATIVGFLSIIFGQAVLFALAQLAWFAPATILITAIFSIVSASINSVVHVPTEFELLIRVVAPMIFALHYTVNQGFRVSSFFPHIVAFGTMGALAYFDQLQSCQLSLLWLQQASWLGGYKLLFGVNLPLIACAGQINDASLISKCQNTLHW